MKAKYSYLLLALAAGAWISANAQSTDAVALKNEMKKLSNWVGRWKGEGTMNMRGTQQKSSVDENIQWRVDETALLVEGLGKNDQGKVVHEALGVLWYDQQGKQFKFRSWLADGRTSDSWFNVLTDNHFQWGFDTPQGKIRYSIKLTASTWDEIGEYSLDGSIWTKFFEMNLLKQ